MATVVAGRYILYGVLAEEHEENNADIQSEHQRVGHTVPLYGTDDQNEALEVYRANGFIRDGKWHVVTWGKDTQTGVTIGDAPDAS